MVVNRDFKWAYHIAKAYSISEVLQVQFIYQRSGLWKMLTMLRVVKRFCGGHRLKALIFLSQSRKVKTIS